MLIYALMLGKLALGLLCLILQINLLGKGNLAPNSATDQVQNYVLGGIIGGVIYNNAISILDFLLVLIAWTLLVLVLKYLKMNSGAIKDFVDGSPAVLIERGKILMDECMRHGMLAHDITLKLRMAGVYYIKDVKRAVLEPNSSPLSSMARRTPATRSSSTDRWTRTSSNSSKRIASGSTLSYVRRTAQ